MYSGYITLAEHWLMMEAVADRNLTNKTGDQSIEFYQTKIQVTQSYNNYHTFDHN